MTSAMANMKYSIMEAAELAAQVCGYSSERVRKWAFALFTSMAAHSNLDGIDDEFVELKLSSDCGKASVHDSLIHSEEFKLAARTYVRENAYKKGEPNMTTYMFK